MRAYRPLLLLCSLALLVSCADHLSVRADMQERSGDSASSVEKRILVTFADPSLERVPVAQPGNYYRPRVAYQSSTWSRRIVAELAEDYELVEITGWPIRELGVHCVVFEAAGNGSVDKVLEKLSNDKRIESVQRMHRFRVLSDPYYRLQAGPHLMQIGEAHRWATGRDTTIAIVDTGVDFDHPDLQGQVTDSEDLVAGHTPDFVDDIHGTAVAGVIAAIADNDEGIVGIAPDSRLFALKACWPAMRDSPAAVCDSLTLAKALDRVITLRPNILNLSLTGPRDPLLARLLDEAIARGIVVVAADPGIPDAEETFPASIDGVIVARVAGAQGSTEQTMHAFEIAAPGRDILTTFPHGGYDFLSGSSLAAAHVSGVVALLLELNPALSSAEVSEILRPINDSSGPLSLSEKPKVVNACEAIAKLRGSVTCSAPVAKRVNSSPGCRPLI